MNRQQIEEKVLSFFLNDLELEPDVVSLDANLEEDLGIDSLDFVDIIVIVHRDFGFKPTPQEMQQVKTVREFCDYIERKLS